MKGNIIPWMDFERKYNTTDGLKRRIIQRMDSAGQYIYNGWILKDTIIQRMD
jgi:hypothetical protein